MGPGRVVGGGVRRPPPSRPLSRHCRERQAADAAGRVRRCPLLPPGRAGHRPPGDRVPPSASVALAVRPPWSPRGGQPYPARTAPSLDSDGSRRYGRVLRGDTGCLPAAGRKAGAAQDGSSTRRPASRVCTIGKSSPIRSACSAGPLNSQCRVSRSSIACHLDPVSGQDDEIVNGAFELRDDVGEKTADTPSSPPPS
jgi:hypothetical protein